MSLLSPETAKAIMLDNIAGWLTYHQEHPAGKKAVYIHRNNQYDTRFAEFIISIFELSYCESLPSNVLAAFLHFIGVLKEKLPEEKVSALKTEVMSKIDMSILRRFTDDEKASGIHHEIPQELLDAL